MRKPLTPEQKEAAAKREKAWREANKQKVSDYQKEYRKINPDSNKAHSKAYRKRNPDTAKASSKKYKDNNQVKVKAYRIAYKGRKNELDKEKKKTDPLYKLKSNLRSGILKAFNRIKVRKNNKSIQILGCSYEEFKIHLELQFESWMTWDNHGLYNGTLNYGWDIDHKIPIAVTEADVIRLSHYTNLQPLCSKVNRDIKRNNHTV